MHTVYTYMYMYFIGCSFIYLSSQVEQITTEYRTKARQFHPDRFMSASETERQNGKWLLTLHIVTGKFRFAYLMHVCMVDMYM